jgi:ribonucleoside-diphosphate reductase alpha chain
MYYLRTKSAVNAKQFTLAKEEKVVTPKPAPVPASAALETQVNTTISNETEMSPEEYKAMIERAKEGEGDDCLMCGS